MGDYALFNKEKVSGEKLVYKYQLRLGSGDALEPFYYRVLYCLRNNRFFRVVKKVKDLYNISPNTQQFGFATSNLRQEITSASSLLGQVGQVVKSIVGMKKDKQRIDECLEYYDDKGKPNEIVLKGLWADFVDSKTGPASLTQAAQKLEFFVARDWFFKLNSLKEIEALGKDVPGNVKTFLTKKYNEYLTWKRNWKPRLEDMQGIINQQLKASKKTVDLYKAWIQPLLKNVEALKMAPDPLNPDLLKIGGSTYSLVEIVAWDKVEPKYDNKVVFTYEEPKTDEDRKKPFGERGKTMYRGKEVPFMPVVNIVFTLRAGQKGTETVVDLYAKLYDKKRFEELYYDTWTKDAATEWIDNLMLKESLPLDIGDEKKAKKEDSFLDNISGRVDELFESISKFTDKFKAPSEKKHLRKYAISKLIKAAGNDVKKDITLIYFVVKKSFGMLADLEMYLGS